MIKYKPFDNPIDCVKCGGKSRHLQFVRDWLRNGEEYIEFSCDTCGFKEQRETKDKE